MNKNITYSKLFIVTVLTTRCGFLWVVTFNLMTLNLSLFIKYIDFIIFSELSFKSFDCFNCALLQVPLETAFTGKTETKKSFVTWYFFYKPQRHWIKYKYRVPEGSKEHGHTNKNSINSNNNKNYSLQNISHIDQTITKGVIAIN